MNSPQLRTAFKTRKITQRVTFAEDIKTTEGAFAVSEGYKIQDTSFLNNNHFNIEQLSVYIGSAEEVEWIARDYEAPPQNEGIVQHHPRRGEIMDLLELAYAADEEDFDRNLKGADWLLLAEEGSSLTGGEFFRSWDAEDFDVFMDTDIPGLDDPDTSNSKVDSPETDSSDTDSLED